MAITNEDIVALLDGFADPDSRRAGGYAGNDEVRFGILRRRWDGHNETGSR
jgi:hypothetical protein